MTEERRVSERRRQVRRKAQAEQPAESPPGQALVPIEPSPSPEPRARRGAGAAFAAQLIGQGGQKRGLRGGSQILDQARSTYMETEWSGPADRRPHPGRITKTEI
jgi:hypothetical protein